MKEFEIQCYSGSKYTIKVADHHWDAFLKTAFDDLIEEVASEVLPFTEGGLNLNIDYEKVRTIDTIVDQAIIAATKGNTQDFEDAQGCVRVQARNEAGQSLKNSLLEALDKIYRKGFDKGHSLGRS